MRNGLIVVGAIAFLAWGGMAAGQEPAKAAAAGPVKAVEMSAKKYEYTPGEIKVKKGERVQLKIRALDRTHGFKLDLRPEGASKQDPPGLRVEPPQDNWKLEKDQERVIEFVAERTGIYQFKCSIFCGFGGHHRMKGKLVVEE